MERLPFKTIAYLLIAFLLVACYDDMAEVEDELITEDGDEYVDGDLAGRIIDQEGAPVSMALLKIAGDDGATSNQGFFSLAGTKLRKNNALVEIKTADNLTYYHCAPVFLNDVSQQVFRLVREVDRTEATFSNGHTLEFQQKATLAIPKDGLSLDGQAADQPISAIYYSIETDANTFLPSTLTDAIENEMLEIRTAIHFNLFNNSGVQVLFNQAIPSTLTFAGHTLQADEFLYYFNPESARWQKIDIQNSTSGVSATITKQGYYCIGRPLPALYLHGTVSSSGNTLPGSKLTVRSGDADQATKILSSTKGAFTALAPRNETISITLFNSCNESIVSQELNENSSLDNILISAPSQINIRGQIKYCSNAIAPEGFLILNDEQFIYSSNGIIDYELLPCEGSIELKAIDLIEDQFSSTVIWNTAEENHVQSFFLCSAAKENYVMLTVDDDVEFYEMTSTSIMGDRLHVQATNMDDDDFEFLLKISANTKGSVADMDLNIVFKDRNLGNDGYAMYCPNSTVGCGFETFELTHYGPSNGDYITGEFEGKFFILTTNNSPQVAYNKRIKGEFRILRNF